MPESFGVLRRRLEQEEERKGKGTREYISVLRLMEKHPLKELTKAVEKGLRVGALSRDAIAQFLYPQEEWAETTFTLDGHEHLRHVRVMQTQLCSYGILVGGAL